MSENGVNIRRLSQRDLVDMIGKARDNRKQYEEAEDRLKAELARRYGEEVRVATQADPDNYTGRTFTGRFHQCTLSWCEKLVLDTEKVRSYLGIRIGQFEKESNHFQVTTEPLPRVDT